MRWTLTRWLAAAVVIASALAVPLLWRRTVKPIEQLVAAAPRTHRTVEARLAGFPWARLQAPTRGKGGSDTEDLKLDGAAGSVLESKDAHSIGVAYLLIDRRTDSIETLERAAEHSRDAAVWNDLAAVRLATALSDDHPAQLPLALAAADHALRLDPRFGPALFNRALILDHLELHDVARSAWRQYLNVDAPSDWSTEARVHLAKLSERGDVFDPKALRNATGAQLEKLVRRFPQEARTWAEGPFLLEWATTDDVALLDRVRAIARVLSAAGHEYLLADAVAAIDRASGKARSTLAAAHRMYGEGRIAYKQHHVAAAESLFRRAAKTFHEQRSAMGEIASYYAAAAAFDLHGDPRELRRLRTQIDSARHIALTATIEGELSVNANREGDWNATIRHAEAAVSRFLSIGERVNAADIDGNAALALELIGEPDHAWRRMIRAFGALSPNNLHDRRRSLIGAASTVLQWCDEPEGAASMLDLVAEDGAGNPVTRAMALGNRARLASDVGDARTALQSVLTARRTAETIPDASVRNQVESQIQLTENVAERRGPRSFDGAIGVLAKDDLVNLLPDAYLQRARADRRVGDLNAALADCRAASREIARQRKPIGDRDLDAWLAYIDEEVTGEIIDLDLSRGDTRAAFDAASEAQPAHTSNTAAAIRLVSLPRSIVAFVSKGNNVTAARVYADRRQVDARIRALTEKIGERSDAQALQKDAAELYDLLIAPIEAQLASVGTLAIAPDRHLANVPFAALYNRRNGRYLVQRFAISIGTPEEGTPQPLDPAVVVADPHTPAEVRLAGARDESREIAAIEHGTMLQGANATRRRFVDAVRNAALIHYSGHAEPGALLLASAEGDDGVLEANEIKKLSLPRRPLVVLAGCDTFRSLAPAFRRAGARGVIGTLWEMDDEASKALFVRIHKRLREGSHPVQALREAQLGMLASTDLRMRHPASWAVEILNAN